MKNLARLTALCALALPALAWANAGLQYPPFSPNSALTLYVSTTGNDTITGIGNNNCQDSTYPCLTLQRASDSVANDTLIRGQAITISMADGTYTSGFITSAPALFTLQGNCTTPSNTTIADGSSNPGAIEAYSGGQIKLRCVKITSTNGSLIFADNMGEILVLDNVIFGAAHFGQIHAESGGLVSINNAYTIAGNAPAHFQPVLNGFIEITDASSVTVTLTGTPAFSTAFADVESGGRVYTNSSTVTFSGAATGQRYLVKGNGVLETLGGSATFLPGNSAGTTSNGGVYE